MAEEKKKEKGPSQGQYYKVEGEQITRLREYCPKCGAGHFLAKHSNRKTCGKCGYTEFEKKEEKKD